jgi:acyl carrier protein phosphodiesterase
MNYLAHVYLSGSNKELAIGNFIADHVKGKAYLEYPEIIQNGILLHRKIDYFTDQHPIFKKMSPCCSQNSGNTAGSLLTCSLTIFWPSNGNCIIPNHWRILA